MYQPPNNLYGKHKDTCSKKTDFSACERHCLSTRTVWQLPPSSPQSQYHLELPPSSELEKAHKTLSISLSHSLSHTRCNPNTNIKRIHSLPLGGFKLLRVHVLPQYGLRYSLTVEWSAPSLLMGISNLDTGKGQGGQRDNCAGPTQPSYKFLQKECQEKPPPQHYLCPLWKVHPMGCIFLLSLCSGWGLEASIWLWFCIPVDSRLWILY